MALLSNSQSSSGGSDLKENPAATKHKSVAAKGDDAAEEQREPKKKPSDEEAAPSNLKKKKPQKQQQESAAVIAVATPSVKDSAQKFSKKTGQEVNDEAVIICACLDSIPKIPVEARVEVMKGNLRELLIREFEACLQRIALLQEVYSVQLEALKEISDGFQ